MLLGDCLKGVVQISLQRWASAAVPRSQRDIHLTRTSSAMFFRRRGWHANEDVPIIMKSERGTGRRLRCKRMVRSDLTLADVASPIESVRLDFATGADRFRPVALHREKV